MRAIDSTGEAVTMAITMLGIMSMWTGLIEIAKRSGLLDQITRKLDPVLHFLFPRIPKDHIAKEYISANIVANLLGLGWAATPMGLKAMKELAKIERERLSDTGRPIRKASDEMCTFLIINISSLQLIPVSTIAYRSQYGSVNPAAVVFPGLIATTISTIVAIIFCRSCAVREKNRRCSYALPIPPLYFIPATGNSSFSIVLLHTYNSKIKLFYRILDERFIDIFV